MKKWKKIKEASELLKDIIDKIKKWDIKRKSEDILCPYCLHNYHKVTKLIGIYICSQCHAFFNYKGKKIKTPIFVENAPEDFTVIYREKDIKRIPFPELTKEEEQNINDFIENIKGDELIGR